MDLIKDIIKLDNRINFSRFQTFLESEVLVPDIKEDVFEIIKTEGYISLKKEDIMEGKIILRGDLNYNVIYITQDKKISNLYGKLELNEVIEKDDITSDMKSILIGDIEHIDCSIINERKIKLGCLVNIKGSLFGRDKIDIVRDITGLDDIQTHRKEIHYEDIVGVEKGESIVKEIISLGENEDIESIISLNPKVKLKETRLSDNKVILGGVVELNPVALSREGDILKLKDNNIEFTQFIEVPGVVEGMKEDAYVELIDFKFDLKEDEEGKCNLLEVDSTVKSRVKVSENITREILEDAYCPYKGLKLDDKCLNLNKLVDFRVEDFVVSESIQNDREDIEIKEILNIDTKVFVTDNFIMENKNTLEGIIHVDILYTPVEGLRPVYTITEEIPFKYSIDLNNTKESMQSYVKIDLEEIDYNLQKNEIDIKIKCKSNFEVVESIESKFIVNGELQGNLDLSSRPSITIYIAKEGETLWDVAKRYNTTLEELAQTNEIDKEEKLKEGQYLIIEKKVVTEI
ncbi:DUF3794 and LysM peptidoglycan-binding domain-containing protein [Tepidibacter formicigenes]|uniref:LysM domain-containing protein n=1 Tax=Tepidibacter formicigenes DSM 15518 TaxID=1123349 RepID=A0A1M6SW25_9FIRM|nr:SPOCS domain-containing protein [Tepidibacter formicigenes]SHK48915.1 protein of unknown function [Tepidibacter formicigenes DSM 15518]